MANSGSEIEPNFVPILYILQIGFDRGYSQSGLSTKIRYMPFYPPPSIPPAHAIGGSSTGEGS